MILIQQRNFKRGAHIEPRILKSFGSHNKYNQKLLQEYTLLPHCSVSS